MRQGGKALPQTRKKSVAPRVVVDNKLRGAYGESDFDTGVIRVNKKRHFQKGYQRINPTKDGHENLASTVQHELLHFKHPKAHEKTIRKMEKQTIARMPAKRKRQLLDLIR